MVHKPPPSGGFLQWWSNDQTFFNEVVHRAQPIQHLGLGLKSSSAQQREAAAGLARAAAGEGSARRGAIDAAIRGAPYAPETRNLMFKRLTCRACPASQTSLSIATLPFLYFASGHTFFTQSLQERLGFLPVCVHTTFQFGDTAEFTWGKRSRLREKNLWAVDDDGYYSRKGPGPHPAEASYEGFLVLTGDLYDWSQLQGKPFSRHEASSAVKVEGNPAFVAKSLETHHVDVLGSMPERNPNRHLLIDAIQRRLVHNAMALGRATKRKVIMPKMWCWCDRFWNPMANCRIPGVSREQFPMPFHCPFDHVYDLEKWMHADAPFREYSFLNSSRIAPTDLADRAYLTVRGASSSGGSAGAGGSTGNGQAGRTVVLEPGATYADAAAALKASSMGSAYVVDIHARSLELLCEDLGSSEANSAFNRIMHLVLGVAEQVRYCDEVENPTYGRGPNAYDEWSNPINCTWGFHRPPPLPEGGAATCERSVPGILEGRWREVSHTFDRPSMFGGFASKRRQAWSTRDRPAYCTQGQCKNGG